MPSHLHEALLELFRNRPSLAAELLAGPLGVRLPPFDYARLDSGDLPDLNPTEYRADAVVVLTTADTPALAVVVEAQLGRDRGKRWSWPVYLATLRARLRCPAVLLVVCADIATAAWCSTPIELGHPGWTLAPVVLGPDRVPVVTDVGDAARAPELAVLSAMAHGTHPDRDKVFHALLTALRTVDAQRTTLYHDLVLAALPEAARHHLEALMKLGTHEYEYQSEFVRRNVVQGRAEGEATALLAVLAARGIEVPDDIRRRITGCTDLQQLETWIRRAATATSVEQLFG
ncbi:hypothetical protein [Prauserella muralis]|uniref:Uncharacterized protein n=1 Tax=Prauserella muralis TaxID=588067 RepID=A0A2V4B0G9_9PSEU|nr:hypothetical protein [Prauserella muralis]PXY27751.1 hypothetical protein BAY60_15330 [Prauserella muralis]TWE22496.1 hypothetical protein FHX69_3738 [Prauserella muralis]